MNLVTSGAVSCERQPLEDASSTPVDVVSDSDLCSTTNSF